MFGMSMGEIAFILVLALVVVGPKNLPKVARTLGRTYGWIRHHLAVMQREINLEMRRIDMEDLEKKAGPNQAPPDTPPPSPAYDNEEKTEETPAHDAADLEGGDDGETPLVEVTTTGNTRLQEQLDFVPTPPVDNPERPRADQADHVEFKVDEEADT